MAMYGNASIKKPEYSQHQALPQMHQSICLNMIVKDKASVIERGLASVNPFVTHWVIADTGAPEDSQQR